MGKLKSSFLLFLHAILFSTINSCEFADNAEAVIPSYICITDFTFQTDTGNLNYQGRNTHDFADMWLNQNGNIIGAVGLPVLLPLQETGLRTINVEAGIKESGQDDVRKAYPFITTYSVPVELSPNQIDTITPLFKYVSNIKFPLIVDYDRLPNSRGFTINPLYALKGDTILEASGPGSREPGNDYMKMEVSDSTTAFQIYTSDEFTFPDLGTPVYLEMDYLADMSLQIGYYYVEPNQPTSPATAIITLYPSATWKKLYLNITDELYGKKTGTSFKFYIGFFNYSGLKPNISLDNIKLVTLD